MTETAPPAWGGDPSIAWRILLTTELTEPLTATDLEHRQVALHREQGWPSPVPVATGDPEALRRDLAEVREVPLVLGISGRTLVISAFHAYVDGLGLLDVLAALARSPVTSSARGVGDRPVGGGGTADRLREVALAPPARVAAPRVQPAEGDAYAVATVPGRVRTAALVHAAARAVVSQNQDAGRPTRHVSVAVGAGRPAPEAGRLANRSELLRLRDVEQLTLDDVADALRISPLSAAGGTGTGSGRLNKLALRVLAPRLGSSVLVSHLGDVTTSAAHDLAFYPVTAGGTGLSLGAVGVDGCTVLTLRARARTWDQAGLAGLLGRVVGSLHP